MGIERQGAVGNQVGGRLVAGDKQQETEVQDLVQRQGVALVLRLD
jgi:hypothetical protein